MTEIRPASLGEPNAPCRSCGAPLAADQRYCLQCGERRAEARLAFLEILAARTAVPAGVVETTVAGPRRSPAAFVGRVGANTVAVAGVACLLLALGVGVLIGKARDSSSSNAGTPQVISVGGVAPAAAVPSAATPAVTQAPPSAPAKAKAHKKSSASSAPAQKTKATNKALQDLSSSSAQDYQKKSAKLPKQLGTGGKAPPKDHKKAAGGGSFTEIG